LAAVYVELVKGPVAGDGIVERAATSPRLLISSFFHGISKVVVRAVVRIGKRYDFCHKPTLDLFLGLAGLHHRIASHFFYAMSKTVTTDLMAVVDQSSQVCDVIFAPIDFPPLVSVTVPRFMC
jgi:hypothetical protein